MFLRNLSRLSSGFRRLSTASTKPQWLDLLMKDHRVYFKDVRHVEKCFASACKTSENGQSFEFSFENSPDVTKRQLPVSYVALRNECQCSKCFDAAAQQKTIEIDVNLDVNESPSEVAFDKDNQILSVKWSSDGHQSVYSGPWIYATFTGNFLEQPTKKNLWTADEYKKVKPTFDYEKIIKDPEEMLKCLKGMDGYGFVTISNAPKKPGVLLDFQKSMNYIKRTHYG